MNSSSSHASFKQFENIFHYASLSLVPISFLSNLLMFKVFSSKNLRKLSISTYFRVISIINLYISLNWIRQFMSIHFDFKFFDKSTLICKFGLYLIYVCNGMLAWNLVAANIDRYLIIAYPNRVHFFKKHSLLIVVILSFYNFALYSFLLIDFRLIPSQNLSNSTLLIMTCSSDSGLIYMLETIDLVSGSLVPFSIMLVSSLAMIVTIIKSRTRMRASSNAIIKNKKSKFKSIKRNVRFAITTIIIDFLFVLCTSLVPIIDFLFFKYKDFFSSDLGNFIFFLGDFLYYLFVAIVFFIQLASNRLVRKNFFKLLC